MLHRFMEIKMINPQRAEFKDRKIQPAGPFGQNFIAVTSNGGQ